MPELSTEEMFEALSDAQNQYEDYLKFHEIYLICQEPQIVDNYARDMNHPLSLSFEEGE